MPVTEIVCDEGLDVRHKSASCPGCKKFPAKHQTRLWEVWNSSGRCIARVPECLFLALPHRGRTLSDAEVLILDEIKKVGAL